MKLKILLLAALLASVGTLASSFPATDSLGRKLPEFEEVGAPREDRFVAMFYFLWHYQHLNEQADPYDISKILAEHPEAVNDGEHPAWGPKNYYHHFAEPLFGYYRSTDEWVYRKHAEMLADAGVDVIIFDTSNGPTYKESYTALCEAFTQAQKDGVKVPKIAFLCRFGAQWPGTVEEIYNELYKPGLFKNLWFHWKGKPLVMAYPEGTEEEIQDFFSFRAPMPTYFDGPSRPDHWSWLQSYPQHAFGGTKEQPEQMAVGVAQNAVDGKLSALSHPESQGRSFHNGKTDERPDAWKYGLNFQEQWDHALEKDPELVFVTGWNEWIAMRLNSFAGYEAPVIFVDLFDLERSRDLEPMKGGYGDLYYYQLISNVRKYKGMEAPNTSGTYTDYRGDTMHRDHPGWGDELHYENRQGRNDIISAKVTHNSKYVGFSVETAEPLTKPEGDSWMLLLIDTDRDKATGWEGYDIVVNRKGPGVLEKGSKHWKLEYNIDGSVLELAVPRNLLGETLDFEFKWVDHLNCPSDIMDFYTCGDAAPGGRFNYRYAE